MKTYRTEAEAIDAVWASMRKDAAARVRQCPHCRLWFEPMTGHHRYCSPRCGQLMRWDRFKDHRVRDYAAEYAKRKAV